MLVLFNECLEAQRLPARHPLYRVVHVIFRTCGAKLLQRDHEARVLGREFKLLGHLLQSVFGRQADMLNGTR